MCLGDMRSTIAVISSTLKSPSLKTNNGGIQRLLIAAWPNTRWSWFGGLRLLDGAQPAPVMASQLFDGGDVSIAVIGNNV